MARLVFLPITDEIRSGTYLLYDGTCSTRGMLPEVDPLAADDTLATDTPTEPTPRDAAGVAH